MKNRRFSLHQIQSVENAPFNPKHYSAFKFGDTTIAKVFAKELFDAFIKIYGEEILKQTEVLLFPSPYNSIPTASNFLCFYFKNLLNDFLFYHEKDACLEAKIHRKQTYVEDYGNMSFDERMSLISNDTYYIDKNFVDGKFCIFIDDIKITGSHERTVSRILKDYDVSGEFIYVYFAELTNDKIHPRIENDYNYSGIETIADILTIIKSSGFRFNTRVVKYILLLDNDKFEFLVNEISWDKLNILLNLAISNNYHQIKEYRDNLYKLKQKLIWQLTYKKDKERV